MSSSALQSSTSDNSLSLDLPQEKLDLLIRTIARGCTPDEFQLFLHACKVRRADPFSKLLYPVKRWDSKQRTEVMQLQSSIDYFRLQAERTGKYAGQLGPQWCGTDGAWKDVWLAAAPPAAARVGVLRSDFKEPLWTVALWTNYVQLTKDGTPTSFWGRMGPLMLAKCAEALSLRRAFPEDLAGLYTPEEMAQADNPRDGDFEVKAPEAPKPTPPPAKKGLDSLTAQSSASPTAPSVNVETGEISAAPGHPTRAIPDPEIAAHQWQGSPDKVFDVDIPVTCPMWNLWADKALPKSAISAKGAKTWREASKGTIGGYRYTVMQEAVSFAQQYPEQATEFHERCACALAVLRWRAEATPQPPAKTEPAPGDQKHPNPGLLFMGVK